MFPEWTKNFYLLSGSFCVILGLIIIFENMLLLSVYNLYILFWSKEGSMVMFFIFVLGLISGFMFGMLKNQKTRRKVTSYD